MNSSAPAALAGRSIQEVTDVSPGELLYLFERARRLKARSIEGGVIAQSLAAPPLCPVEDADVPEKVGNHDSTVYLMFMEGSTRTRESFRNAGTFHGVKVNEFQAATSSFTKSETITDAMKMLSGYSTERTVFVIRSPLEGVCRWLEMTLPAHAAKSGIPKPVFLNAGDGRLTHPTGEFVDQFSLLERRGWDRSAIHLALVGDLSHGRTAHSKVDGLKVFEKVRVDLIAPAIFAYPVEYKNKMRQQGFEVREFSSTEEYMRLAKDDLAPIWYFYQCQFKRCGDLDTVAKDELRRQCTFQAEWESALPQNSAFFQTLPRYKERPVIPLSFDNSPLNSWDRHASNAYYVNTVLLGMLFGRIGRGIAAEPAAAAGGAGGYPAGLGKSSSLGSLQSLFPFKGPTPPASLPRFLKVAEVGAENRRQPQRARPGGPVPITDGLVVDHIGLSPDSMACWRRLRMVRLILGWADCNGTEGVYESAASKDGSRAFKGIISLPHFDFTTVSVPQMKTLASVAPGCTINAIKGSEVVNKYRLLIPERIYNLPNIACRNASCVSHPENKQRDVTAYFERVHFYETSALKGKKPAESSPEYLFVCRYCKWPHYHEDIWLDAGKTR